MPPGSTILLGGCLRNVEKKIALRVDASSQIGTGHFMRCLTLANALRARGARTRFVSRHLPEHLRSKLVEKGHEFVLLDTVQNDTRLDELAHALWLGVSQQQDAVASMQALSDQHWDWLIVDHYALDARWESELRQSTRKILIIDDIADRQHNCEALLDQNLYVDMQTRYAGKVPAHCQLLLGPRYALLRDEFRRLRDQIKPRSGPVKRILIFFGGVDADNYTSQAIDALAQMEISEIHVDVVIGAQHPCRERIETECVQRHFICHVQTKHMAKLMGAADLAIGAGGSACWERCSLGLPALLVSLADNQIDIAKALDLFGACIYVGSSKSISPLMTRDALVRLLNRQEQLEGLSRKAYSLVDGLGVGRVCQEMIHQDENFNSVH
ncbi:UDP-2,4-diacetamido-2,4, 6-trideoxy-beta-L-altropyranose hydrolase [Methylophilaceae bacterium]|nr:UDP-2,4-diacetamido-2,4, 6-trideoxy-beta-L-altropyranose hydrolase [Methylophilaceae bacterium]